MQNKICMTQEFLVLQDMLDSSMVSEDHGSATLPGPSAGDLLQASIIFESPRAAEYRQ